jgi:hypothetical protein
MNDDPDKSIGRMSLIIGLITAALIVALFLY